MLGKRGDERLLTPWMFAIWVLIGIGIITGVIIFYSSKSDTREYQAEILATRIIECVINDNNLNVLLNEKDGFDFFSKCNLNKQEFEEQKKFYFNISIRDFSTKEIIFKDKIIGNADFATQCGVQESSEAYLFAKCHNKKVYSIYSKDNNLEKTAVLIEITAGSNNIGGQL